VTAAVAPADIIEEFWIRDVVDLFWDVLRFRRLKANLLLACALSGLEKILLPILGWSEANDLAFRRVC
jgi:hypothetical protein